MFLNNSVFGQALLPSIILFFLTSGIIALVIGVGLIFFSSTMLRFFGKMNQYVSTRHAFKPLAVMRDVDEPVRRHRLLFGALIFAGAAGALFGLARVDIAAVVALYSTNLPAGYVAWLLQTLRWSLIALTAFALVIGVLLMFFPAALGRIEKRANHWYSIRQRMQGVDTMHLPLDRRVAAYPRAFGLVVVLAALFLVADSAVLLSSLP